MDNNDFDNILKILLAGGSLTAGAFLTALRARLANTKKKNWLHVSFYIVSGLVIFGVIVTCLLFWSDIIKPNWFAVIVLVIATVFSIALIWVTNKFLTGKHQYKSKDLDNVVNKFSKNADKRNIKLLAGNLDFFGASEQLINEHPQYKCLRQESFRQIYILCTAPITIPDKIRYGKIITDLPMVELRYYKPDEADLNVRGRIKTLNGVDRLLIYNKVDDGLFEALELDTADTNGAHYTHLWNLIWQLADTPSKDELNEYKGLYRP